MKIGNLFKIALKALNNNKMRCFLTMLGIIIGVASVITMLAIGQGSKDSIKKQISEMGSNMIMIFPGNMERGGVQQSSDDMQSMKPVDYENIRDEAKFVAAVSPMVSSQGQFICGANNYPSKVEGVNADYLEIRKLKVKDGMAFSDLDIKRASKVCVVGKTVVDKLFPNGGNPMGRVIRFNSIPLTIIGVLESKGYNSMGQDQDDIVLAPYTTVMKRILAIDYIQGIFASALTEAATDQATDEIEKILNRNHKIKSEDEEDYDIRSQQELSEMLNSTGDMMTLLLACVAGISLLVGGIGIEHHARVGDRAHARDWPAHEHRRARTRHHDAVSHRVDNHQRSRRRHRRGAWRDSVAVGEIFIELACDNSNLFCSFVIPCVHGHRSVFRVVSGAQGGES